MRIAPLTHGIFWLASGLWPIVHVRSFEAVTGKKREIWLVRTMGGLIAAVGGALLVGAFERPTRSLRTLGAASAATLAAADLVYAGKGRISPVYFADAAVEATLFALWLATERAPH